MNKQILSEQLSRLEEVAKDAGTSFYELVELVIASHHKTGRDQSTTINAIKIILTRLSRQSIIDQMKSLGITITNSNCQQLSPFDLLVSIAKSFNTLNKEVQKEVLELGAGVFMLTEFKVLLLNANKRY